jgi:hypothetical protein
MSKMLLIGEDSRLLATRAAVMATTGASVVCCRTAEFRTNLEHETFDLVVLCHSVDEKSVIIVEDAIRARWPELRVLQIVSYSQERDRAVGGADGVSDADPERLIKRCMELLGAPTDGFSLASIYRCDASKPMRPPKQIFKAGTAS